MSNDWAFALAIGLVAIILIWVTIWVLLRRNDLE
jgi:hypothetical protein